MHSDSIEFAIIGFLVRAGNGLTDHTIRQGRRLAILGNLGVGRDLQHKCAHRQRLRVCVHRAQLAVEGRVIVFLGFGRRSLIG